MKKIIGSFLWSELVMAEVEVGDFFEYENVKWVLFRINTRGGITKIRKKEDGLIIRKTLFSKEHCLFKKNFKEEIVNISDKDYSKLEKVIEAAEETELASMD